MYPHFNINISFFQYFFINKLSFEIGYFIIIFFEQLQKKRDKYGICKTCKSVL
jgi:hypothetical protein